jgi:hypothetical protein
MPVSKATGLSPFKDILLAHEQDYRQYWRAERQEIVQDIMEEMVAQSKGPLDKDLMKDLEQVS